MLLETPNLQIIPFETGDWEHIARWFYDPEYWGFFRHQPRAYKIHEFQTYPQIVKAEIFMVRLKATAEVIGMVQLMPDGKANRGFHIGLIVDKKYQKQRFPLEIFLSVFDYCFNRMGYRKAMIEILESNEGLKRTLVESGFLFEGKFIGECFMDGQWVNELRYCMFDSFFNKKSKPTVDSWR